MGDGVRDTERNRVGFGHERSTIVGESDEWLTPPDLIEALGPFDLDPCSPVVRPWPTASRHYTVEDDGLRQPWGGFVWLNPPYGRETWRWLTKLASHGNGLALIFARTETRGFFAQAWERADAMLFLHGRLAFWNVDGTEGAGATAPSVLLAYGAEAVAIHDEPDPEHGCLVSEHPDHPEYWRIYGYWLEEPREWEPLPHE